MVLYTTETWRYITEEQLQTNIASAFQSSNAALANSGIDDLEFNLVHVGRVSSGRLSGGREGSTPASWWCFLCGRSGATVVSQGASDMHVQRRGCETARINPQHTLGELRTTCSYGKESSHGA